MLSLTLILGLIRMTSLSSIITAIMALLTVLDKDISAPLPGFALAFGNTVRLIASRDVELIGNIDNIRSAPPLDM
jgi:hypothetical protein